MIEIQLTQNKVALVDDEDYAELSKYKWYTHKERNVYYVVRNSQRINGKRHMIYMHAVIADTPPGMDTDHINGNGLDNRRENLRVVTHRENLQNRHPPKSSKFPGVTWDKRANKWITQIYVAGKLNYLGRYDSEEVAARRYQIACDWQAIKV